MKISNIILFSLCMTKALQGNSTDDVFLAFENGKISDAQMKIFDRNEETKVLASLLQSFFERLEKAPNTLEKMQFIDNLYLPDSISLEKFKGLGLRFLEKKNRYALSYEDWCKRLPK